MKEKSVTEKIIVFLLEYPGASIKDIAQGVGISPSLARAILYRLKSRGVVSKAGIGYVLTRVGEEIAGKIREKYGMEERKKAGEKREAKEDTEKTGEHVEKAPATTPNITELEEKLREIEGRIKSLEAMLAELKNTLNGIKKAVREAKKSKRTIKREAVKVERLPKPIMSIMEARSSLGGVFDSLVYSGKVVVVGSLAIDGDYYREFISRFPITVKEAEKFSEQEKMLLEALKNEGKVYLYAGKEYRLV